MFKDYYTTNILPQYQAHFERNIKIRIAYSKRKETKATYKSVGKDHGITTERVRQIVAKLMRMEHWQLRTMKPRDEFVKVMAKYGYTVDENFDTTAFLEHNTLFDDGPLQRELYKFRVRDAELKFFQVVFARPKVEYVKPPPPPLPSTFGTLTLETQRALNWHGVRSLLGLHDWLVRITKRHPDLDTREALLRQHWIGERRTKEILAFAESMKVWSNKTKPMSKRRTIK